MGAWFNEKLDELADEIVTDPDLLLEFAKKWQNGFHNYSFHNKS